MAEDKYVKRGVSIYRMVFYKDIHHNKNSLYHNTTENDSWHVVLFFVKF